MHNAGIANWESNMKLVGELAESDLASMEIEWQVNRTFDDISFLLQCTCFCRLLVCQPGWTSTTLQLPGNLALCAL